jgi:hypothetical protein
LGDVHFRLDGHGVDADKSEGVHLGKHRREAFEGASGHAGRFGQIRLTQGTVAARRPEEIMNPAPGPETPRMFETLNGIRQRRPIFGHWRRDGLRSGAHYRSPFFLPHPPDPTIGSN